MSARTEPITGEDHAMTASDGHVAVPVPDGEPSPYDTCERCGKPIRYRAESGAWVTMIGASSECYGRRP